MYESNPRFDYICTVTNYIANAPQHIWSLYAMELQKGKKYVMKKFNGSLMPNEEVEDSENYWKLLSKKVSVCAFAEEEKFPNNERILVQFECDLEDLGLISHNRLPNSLWILKSDLEPVIE